MNIRTGIRSRVTAATVVAGAAATVAPIVAPAHAAGYIFKPGHPAIYRYSGGQEGCTGGYAIRGPDGMFILTAAHCGRGANVDGVPGDQVRGHRRTIRQHGLHQVVRQRLRHRHRLDSHAAR